jgi:hypothetical protein
MRLPGAEMRWPLPNVYPIDIMTSNILTSRGGDQYLWNSLESSGVCVAEGKLDQALALYTKAQIVAQRLASSDRSNAGLQAGLATSHGKLGHLHVKLSDPRI